MTTPSNNDNKITTILLLPKAFTYNDKSYIYGIPLVKMYYLLAKNPSRSTKRRGNL